MIVQFGIFCRCCGGQKLLLVTGGGAAGTTDRGHCVDPTLASEVAVVIYGSGRSCGEIH